MDFEIQLNVLSEEFGFEQNIIKSIYKTLQTKDCFARDEDQERKYECLYRILLEISEIANRTDNNYEKIFLKSVEDKCIYKSTSDYAINKGLFETYRKDSINDLSDNFINYLSEQISYNRKSELDNFYEEYNFGNNDEIESSHHR